MFSVLDLFHGIRNFNTGLHNQLIAMSTLIINNKKKIKIFRKDP